LRGRKRLLDCARRDGSLFGRASSQGEKLTGCMRRGGRGLFTKGAVFLERKRLKRGKAGVLLPNETKSPIEPLLQNWFFSGKESPLLQSSPSWKKGPPSSVENGYLHWNQARRAYPPLFCFEILPGEESKISRKRRSLALKEWGAQLVTCLS